MYQESQGTLQPVSDRFHETRKPMHTPTCLWQVSCTRKADAHSNLPLTGFHSANALSLELQALFTADLITAGFTLRLLLNFWPHQSRFHPTLVAKPDLITAGSTLRLLLNLRPHNSRFHPMLVAKLLTSTLLHQDFFYIQTCKPYNYTVLHVMLFY